MRGGYWLATIGTKNVIDGATPMVLIAYPERHGMDYIHAYVVICKSG